MNGTARLASGALAALLLTGTGQAAAPPGGIIVDITPARQSRTRSDVAVVTVTARAVDNADSHEYVGENNPYRPLRPAR